MRFEGRSNLWCSFKFTIRFFTIYQHLPQFLSACPFSNSWLMAVLRNAFLSNWSAFFTSLSPSSKLDFLIAHKCAYSMQWGVKPRNSSHSPRSRKCISTVLPMSYLIPPSNYCNHYDWSLLFLLHVLMPASNLHTALAT